MDLTNHVILPREDFVELQTTAYEQTQTIKERVVGTIHYTVVCGVTAGVVAASSWAYAKAMDWKDAKSFERELERAELNNNTYTSS